MDTDGQDRELTPGSDDNRISIQHRTQSRSPKGQVKELHNSRKALFENQEDKQAISIRRFLRLICLQQASPFTRLHHGKSEVYFKVLCDR